MWKSQAMNSFSALFSQKKEEENEVDVQQFYAQIGKIQIRNDF
jgi:hypothetical protein